MSPVVNVCRLYDALTHTSLLPVLAILSLVTSPVKPASFSGFGRTIQQAMGRDLADSYSNYMSYGCERNFLQLGCGRGSVIGIVSAMYGRKRDDICAEGDISTEGWNMNCTGHRGKVLRNVAEKCTGKNACTVPILNENFKVFVCPDTPKYLEVLFKCVPDTMSMVELQALLL